MPANDVMITNLAATCVSTWHREVVNRTATRSTMLGGAKRYRPFRTSVDSDVEQRRAVLREAGAELAKAGAKLHWFLFGSPDPDLVRIRDALGRALTHAPITLRIISKKMLIPWSLLYTHPVPGERLSADGSNFRWEGFWGYRHVIDHEIGNNPGGIALHPDNERRIPTGVHIDAALKVQRPEGKVPLV